MAETPSLQLANAASSTSSLAERAQEMLEALRHLVPFDAAWLALADPMSSSYSSLASRDLDEGVLRYFSGPKMAHDIELTHTNRARPPLSPSDLPYPASELRTWAECLIPAGFHEALAVALFTREQHHVGFLALLSDSAEPPPLGMRRRLHRVTSVLARGADPMRSLATTARVVKGATAGAVLCSDRGTRPLPGLHSDTLFADGSPVVAIACSCIDDGQIFASFLWPRGGRYAPDGHVRVTILANGEQPSAGLLGTVVISPATHLRGLTSRELEVLGLLVDGCSNQQIAQALVVAPRTVATHLEHILAKLEAPTRTLAAVRAEREGLYTPPSPLYRARITLPSRT
ncbi:Two-component response regulator [Modestobacter italicus]|uniref:Two-component response regulator n=1 Tax=Modestobacter italicus (strain DSM 44449 / CECT 9708 / BC 501) TaxID=2732864 RepID=I4F0E1_MODI5|nr:LuxR C-terminal-related transcriptional regulator [Modestobacter marinus]CCH89104.1 Two-component response regulator [Modestobacter marinus]